MVVSSVLGLQVFSEHDNSFKELNSQLLREAAAHDWARSARALAGDDASFHGDWQNEPSSAAVTPIGHRLGGLAASDSNAQAAAAQAAVERARAWKIPSVAEVHVDSAAGGQSQQASIDSLGPMDGSLAGDVQQQDDIQGLGHLDGTTEELEAAMRKLGTPTASHPKDSPFTMQRPGASSDSNASSEDTHPMSSSTEKDDQQPAQHLADSTASGAGEARQQSLDQHAEQPAHPASSSAGKETEEHMEQDIEQYGEQEAEEGSQAVRDPDCIAAAQEAMRRLLSAAGPAETRAVLQSVLKILQVFPIVSMQCVMVRLALSHERPTDKGLFILDSLWSNLLREALSLVHASAGRPSHSFSASDLICLSSCSTLWRSPRRPSSGGCGRSRWSAAWAPCCRTAWRCWRRPALRG